MTWQCNFVGNIDLKQYKAGMYPVGTIFWGPTEAEVEADHERKLYNGWFRLQVQRLSDYYKANNAHRRPLFVILPSNALFCIDGQCWSNGEHYGGWTVTGEPQSITVSPSINVGGSYHGFLQNGVLTDDCEGRTYDAQGNLIYVEPK